MAERKVWLNRARAECPDCRRRPVWMAVYTAYLNVGYDWADSFTQERCLWCDVKVNVRAKLLRPRIAMWALRRAAADSAKCAWAATRHSQIERLRPVGFYGLFVNGFRVFFELLNTPASWYAGRRRS